MHAQKIVSAGISGLILTLALAGLPGTALADRGDRDHASHRYERHEHHHWRAGPPRRYKERVEYHHYYHGRPSYRDGYVRRDYYYPRYRDNEFTIIYRGGW
jgi:hypothetical protein